MSVAYLNSHKEERTVMEEHGGFALIYRSLSKQPWYKNSAYTHLFIHMLSKVAHKPLNVSFHGFDVNILPGQMVTSLNQLSKETGINVQTVRRAIKKFKSLGQISALNVEGGKGKEISYTVIKLSNWSKFNQKQQKSDIPSDIPSDTPSDIPLIARNPNRNKPCGASNNNSDTPSDIPSDTPSDIQNNKDLTINKDIYVKNEDKFLTRDIVKIYNESFPDLACVAKLTKKRQAKLRKLTTETFTLPNGTEASFKKLEDWQELFDWMQGSDFLMGRASDWRMTFDFMINPENFIKIMEGNYENK